MIKTTLIKDTEVRKTIERKGPFSVLEYQKDISVNSPAEAIAAYYASKMNIRKRQVYTILRNSGVTIQKGEMQMMLGDISASTNVKGAGDLFKKYLGSKVTGESAIKPLYFGTGLLVLEPTYKHVLLEEVSDWNGSMVIEDGLFLACEDSVGIKVVSRSSLSSAIAGGEGLFNTALTGKGIVALESPVPRSELIYVDLENDVLKIDGNYAIAWSNTLSFTVERSSKTLVGSATGGEGLVNVYRGTGRVLIAPVDR